MRVIPVLFLGLFVCSGLFSPARADDLRRSKGALADGRYLTALYLAEQAFAAGTNPPAAALVMARAADLGRVSDRRTEQLYLHALELSKNKAPVLGHLTLFYLQRGQTAKADQTQADFAALCRYNCADIRNQIKAAKHNR